MSLESALPGGVFCRAELSAQTVGWGGSEFAVRKTMWSREAGGKGPGSRGVGGKEDKTKIGNVTGRRIGKTPCHLLQCGHLPLSKPPCLLSDPAKSLPSWPWGTRHQPPPLQPDLQRGAAPLSSHVPISLYRAQGLSATALQHCCLGGCVLGWLR